MTQAREIIHRARALPLREAGPASLLLSLLADMGWHRSVRGKVAVAADGSPLPWWTYSAIAWIGLILRPHHRVFEFGSGNSTLWLAPRVETIHSVEHDPGWAPNAKLTLPHNARVSLVETHGTDADAARDDPYLEPLQREQKPFDLIVVDGVGRNACVAAAIPKTCDAGLILLDDSDRLTYRPAHELLGAAGFGRLDFFGPKPAVGHMSTTSVFSRDFDPWSRGLDPPAASGY